ncbi:MAG: Uma2 family endonuclease [Terracidiphilus sp.]
MATQPVFEKPVSVEQYLSTVYEHDCEYVDGVIEERDFGEFEHAYVQGILVALFNNHRADWGVYALPELRVQTQKAHFRVPDVTVLRERSKREPVLTHPPLLIVEVQSPDQSLRYTEAKTLEYITFGVEHVWVVDPYARAAWRGTINGLELIRNGELSIPDTPIRIVLEEIFAELDRL